MDNQNDISAAAAALGRQGGKSRSPAKQAASRRNGAQGGRPKTSKEMCFRSGFRGFGWARGYFADGRFRVSSREAARLCRVWRLTPDCLSDLYVYSDGFGTKRVPVWTR